jgi:hypothetical protein
VRFGAVGLDATHKTQKQNAEAKRRSKTQKQNAEAKRTENPEHKTHRKPDPFDPGENARMMVSIEDRSVLGIPFPIVSLLDRRSTRAKTVRMVFVRSVERIVYHAHERSSGVLSQALQRLGMDATIFHVDKKAVDESIVTQQEADQILAAFRPACVVDVEAARKVRQCSLIPVAVCVSACQAYGRCAETTATLQELKSLPRAWSIEMQHEEDTRNGELDLVLQDQRMEANDEDLEMYDLATELVLEVRTPPPLVPIEPNTQRTIDRASPTP